MKTTKRFPLALPLVLAALLLGCQGEEFAATQLDKNPIKRRENPDVGETIINCENARAEGRMLTFEQEVFFPATRECDWGQGGNLSILNARLRARTEQTVTYTLPNDFGTLCDLDLASETQSMEYDDEIILTFNDTILAMSQNYSSPLYQNPLQANSDGHYVYAWEHLVDKYYAHNYTGVYCLGHAGAGPLCQVPRTETSGNILIDIPSEEIIRIMASTMDWLSLAQGELEFGWITVGDNDPGDCEHADYRINISIDYIARE